QSRSGNFLNETNKEKIRGAKNEDTTDRFSARVGGGAPAAAREGEGVDPRPGRIGGRASPDAVAGREEELQVRRTQGQSEPARPVRGRASADPLPRVPRTRRERLARACVCWLLHGGRPSRTRRPSERSQYRARVRLARVAEGHRARE